MVRQSSVVALADRIKTLLGQLDFLIGLGLQVGLLNRLGVDVLVEPLANFLAQSVNAVTRLGLLGHFVADPLEVSLGIESFGAFGKS